MCFPLLIKHCYQLQKERDRLLEELSEMRRGQVEANNIVNKRREEKNRLEEEGISYWRIFCDYKCQLIALEDENRRYFLV